VCNEYLEKIGYQNLAVYKGIKLNIERSCEPSQILWENLHNSWKNIMWKSGFIWGLVIFFAGISLSMAYGFYAITIKNKENMGIGILLNILNSFIIIMLNKFLGFILYWVSTEYHTRLHKSQAYTLKLSVVFLAIYNKIK